MRFRSGLRLAAVLGTAALLPLAATGAAVAAHSPGRVFKGTKSVLTAAQAERLAARATHRSIIIFKNQLTSLPATGATANARVQAANTTQAGVLSELRQVHATHVHSYHIIDAISATISAAEATRLQHNSAVRAVVPDAMRHFASLGSGAPALPSVGHGGRRLPANSPSQQICPSNPAQPLVEPEAREVMNVDAANQIVNGSGIKVGIIADGIDPNNADLIRAGGQHVIFDYRDFSGYGPSAPTDGRESFLDAGTIASVANTNPFDSAVTSTSGDLWAQSVNASAPYSPLTLAPGQKGTIRLTITPNAPKGTVVHGFIGVDALNLATVAGDELVNIPYAYKVG